MWYIALIIAFVSYKLGWLAQSGAICAALVGSVVFQSGVSATIQMLVFFLLGSVFTKVQQEKKDKALPYQPPVKTQAKSGDKAKKEGRTGYQVIATGGVPAILCAFYTFNYLSPTAFHILYSILMAVNLGDTLASEIGMLSNQTPRLITNWQLHVNTGVDGGITFVGSLAACFGGTIIGICEGSWISIWLCTVYALIGSGIDSLMGVYFQSKPSLPTSSNATSSKKPVDSMSASQITLLQPRNLSYSKWSSLNASINFGSSVMTAVLALLIHELYASGKYNLYPMLSLLFGLLLIRSLPLSNSFIDAFHGICILLWSIAYRSYFYQVFIAYMYLLIVYSFLRRTPAIKASR